MATSEAHGENAISQRLRRSQDLFIRRWGEMGQTWGINRTMAEIHALLYVTGQALCTDDVMERLHISRGSASTSLRALCNWGIVRRVHKLGQRREYFQSVGDVWEMFSSIVAERKRREIDPVLEIIRQCRQMLEAEAGGGTDTLAEEVRMTHQRLVEMEQFMTIAHRIFQQFVVDGKDGLSRLAEMLLKAL